MSNRSDLIKKIMNKDGALIKKVCKYASGRIEKNEYTNTYNSILKQKTWSNKQRKVVLLYLFHNLMYEDLKSCIEKVQL